MDFTLGPTQQAAAEAAAHVLGGYRPRPEASRDGCAGPQVNVRA